MAHSSAQQRPVDGHSCTCPSGAGVAKVNNLALPQSGHLRMYDAHTLPTLLHEVDQVLKCKLCGFQVSICWQLLRSRLCFLVQLDVQLCRVRLQALHTLWSLLCHKRCDLPCITARSGTDSASSSAVQTLLLTLEAWVLVQANERL